MTNASMDVEHTARAFPSPQDSTPARSLTYRCGGRTYRAVIGQPRRQCEDVRGAARRGKPAGRAGPATGNTVLSIVATRAAVEIWSREPARDWPNPSLIGHDAVLTIDYLDSPDTITSLRPVAGGGQRVPERSGGRCERPGDGAGTGDGGGGEPGGRSTTRPNKWNEVRLTNLVRTHPDIGTRVQLEAVSYSSSLY